MRLSIALLASGLALMACRDDAPRPETGVRAPRQQAAAPRARRSTQRPPAPALEAAPVGGEREVRQARSVNDPIEPGGVMGRRDTARSVAEPPL